MRLVQCAREQIGREVKKREVSTRMRARVPCTRRREEISFFELVLRIRAHVR